jgi:hypothetical protein
MPKSVYSDILIDLVCLYSDMHILHIFQSEHIQISRYANMLLFAYAHILICFYLHMPIFVYAHSPRISICSYDFGPLGDSHSVHFISFRPLCSIPSTWFELIPSTWVPPTWLGGVSSDLVAHVEVISLGLLLTVVGSS